MRIFWSGIVMVAIGMLGATMVMATEPGETLEVEISPEGVGTVRATINLPANRVKVRTVLMDYAHWPELFPRKPTILYVKEHGSHVRVGMTVPAFFLPMTLQLVTETHEPQPFRIVTQMVEGDFERYDWVWELTPLGDGTHSQATLVLNVKPQFWTPDWPLKWILKTDLQEHFELLRKALTFNNPRISEEPPQIGPKKK